MQHLVDLDVQSAGKTRYETADRSICAAAGRSWRAQLIHLDVQQLLGLNVAADRYTVQVQQLLGLHVQQLSSC